MTGPRVVLDDAEFARLQQLLSRSAGLVFDDARRESLSYSIGERLRATGIRTVPEYLDAVSARGAQECQWLLDEVTIQETHFFRNPPQMRALRAHLLPELVRGAEARGRRLRVWSAGCSTGEEPYTVAMMLRELLPRTAGWDVKVLATDLSVSALDAAHRAVYGPRSVQLASADRVARFFVALPDGRYEVRPEVRELVELSHHNLVLDDPPGSGLDLVLCRNVTIYFARETTRALMGRLHSALRDGGYLLLGHSETLWQVNDDFRLVTLDAGSSPAYVYRRLGPAAADRRAVLADRRTVPEQHPGPEPRTTVRRSAQPPGAHPTRPHPSGGHPSGGHPSGGHSSGAHADASASRSGRPASGEDAAGAQTVATDSALAADDRCLSGVCDALAAGRYAEAARLARLAADAEPLRPEAHYLLGRALVDQGLDVEALPALRRAVYLDPAAGLAHFLLAGALARCGDRTAAAREYRAAATALGRSAGDLTAPELGGRSAQELAELCVRLERQLSAGAQA